MKKLILLILLSISFAQVKPNTTILISFDAFRWDFPDRGLSPNLQSLIDRGVKAASLQPCFPSKTFPNHYSIITGMYPENHGIIFNYIKDDFKDMTYSLGRREEVKNAKWYQGEALWETAERQGVISASYFWPGSEVLLEYRHPTYFEVYEHDRDYKKRIDDILEWVNLPEEKRPVFISLYFDATDTYGHKFGPNSPQNNKAIANLDHMLGRLMKGLKSKGKLANTNIIVVSDHGMTNISSDKVINIEKIISDYKVKFNNSGPVLTIKPKSEEITEVYKKLKAAENHYKVYLKKDVPAHYHFSNNPHIYPIVVIAELGWSALTERDLKKSNDNYSKGNHGYDNFQLDMHGIFIAAGPDFKNNYKCGTIDNIHIYPLICKILKIYPRQNIDGKLEKIEFLLKEKN